MVSEPNQTFQINLPGRPLSTNPHAIRARKYRHKYPEKTKAQHDRYRSKNIGKQRIWEKQHTLREKFTLYQILGGRVCVKCGFSDWRALQIAHKNGSGSQDRKKFKYITTMYRYYRKNPDEARKKLKILCANCNWIERYD